mgnify:CR=1 FL=1
MVLGKKNLSHRDVSKIVEAVHLTRLTHCFCHDWGHHGKEYTQ